MSVSTDPREDFSSERSTAAAARPRRAVRLRAIAGCVAVLAPFAAVSSAPAVELYRWVEPDGSITFSPNRPPEGVAFETVQAGGAAPGLDAVAGASEQAPAGLPPAPSPVATPTPLSDPGTAVAGTDRASAPSSGAAGAGVAFAPPPLGAAVATPNRESLQSAPGADAPASTTGAAAVPNTADARRRSQCRELEKRVVSLERSLMVEMPPARMDDTVLTMARYQNSLDDHCRR